MKQYRHLPYNKLLFVSVIVTLLGYQAIAVNASAGGTDLISKQQNFAEPTPIENHLSQVDSLEKRSMQTRKYEGIAEADILSASAGVLQDLGFLIEESETKLGVIVGSKQRDATDGLQLALAVFAALAGAGSTPIDSHQKIRASLVIRPIDDNNHFVRVTFQRVVWNTKNKVSLAESIEEPKIYQDFFDKLSKSIFLEGHKI